jgi:hypothetical protein
MHAPNVYRMHALVLRNGLPELMLGYTMHAFEANAICTERHAVYVRYNKVDVAMHVLS